MKRNLLLLGLMFWTFLFAIEVRAAPQHENYVGGGDVSQTTDFPLKRLAKALRADQKSSRFRLDWSIYGTLFSGYGIVFYDRRRHTLKYYSFSEDLVSEEPVVKRARSREYYLYHGVSDQTIYRLDKKNRESNGLSIDAYFSELPLFGCRKQTLRYNVTYWTPR